VSSHEVETLLTRRWGARRSMSPVTLKPACGTSIQQTTTRKVPTQFASTSQGLAINHTDEICAETRAT
jgi:hypothetical protein